MKTSTTRTVARAVAAAMAGTVLSAAGVSTAVAGTVNYNAFNQGVAQPWDLVSGGHGTDGWMRSAANASNTPAACQTAGSTCGQGPSTGNYPAKVVAAGNVAVPWAGTDPRNDPTFNYTGTQTLNWSATIGPGESVTVSKTDSITRYGGTTLSNGETFQWADIDTAKGAWHDNVNTGWAHDTDIGIFKSEVTQQVTLRIASLLPNGAVNETPDYGITVFQGISTLSSNYNHHKAWHSMDPSVALAVGEPDAFLPGLAISFNNLALSLGRLKRHSEAVDAFHEAVRRYRALAEELPDAFLQLLAMSLSNLSTALGDLDRSEEALAPAGEAVDIYRRLVALNPESFSRDLATSLNNLGVRLTSLGRDEMALPVIRESLEIRRKLADSAPQAFGPDLAVSWNNLAGLLRRGGATQDEALAASESAIRILSPFFLRLPAAYSSWMASTLRCYVECCDASGKAPDRNLVAEIEAAWTGLADDTA